MRARNSQQRLSGMLEYRQCWDRRGVSRPRRRTLRLEGLAAPRRESHLHGLACGELEPAQAGFDGARERAIKARFQPPAEAVEESEGSHERREENWPIGVDRSGADSTTDGASHSAGRRRGIVDS